MLNIFFSGIFVGACTIGNDGLVVGETVTGETVGGRNCEGLRLIGLLVVVTGANVVGAAVGVRLGRAVGDGVVVGAADIGAAVIGAAVGIHTLE